MSRDLTTRFFPVTFGELFKNHAPLVFDFVFPEWVAKRCPMPSVDVQVPGIGAVTLSWPASAAVILCGFVTCLVLGTRTFARALREGSHSRQGSFFWSASLLWYATMCAGGLFFHCLHITYIAHILDLVGTGLSALSIIGGFLAFTGHLDDRTARQRGAYGLGCAAFIAVAILAPPIVQEQMYVLPSLLSAGVGAWFMRKDRAEKARASRWLVASTAGVVVGLGAVPLDSFFCVAMGKHFGLLFWFFTGCNLAVLSANQFAVSVTDNNLRFTDEKTH